MTAKDSRAGGRRRHRRDVDEVATDAHAQGVKLQQRERAVIAPETTPPVDVDTPRAGVTNTRSWRIAFPPRQELLNANQRLHWAAKARITKQLRSDAFVLARYHKLPHLARVHVFCVVQPDPRVRRRDPGNWAPSAKAMVDGLVDAGVCTDDDSKHLIGPDMRLGEPYPGGRLVLIIHELPEETSP